SAGIPQMGFSTCYSQSGNGAGNFLRSEGARHCIGETDLPLCRPFMAVETKASSTSSQPSFLQQASSAAEDVMRSLPHAVGPEKSLLSSMLQDPQDYIGIAIEEKLTKEHFYLPSHSTLFGFLVELFEAGQEIELVSLVQRLLDKGL